jgi:hypothetical protein
LQLVAPQAPPTHAAVQHSSVVASQTSDAHWLLAEHAPPRGVWVHPLVVHTGSLPVQVCAVPAMQPFVATQVCAGVNTLPLHEAPAQVCCVPGTQVLLVQVCAGVNVLPLHEAGEHSALVLQPTQPVVLQASAQVVGVPATQPFVALQVAAGVNVLPLHEAAAQTCVVPATQPFVGLQVAAGVNSLPLHAPAAQVCGVPATQTFPVQVCAGVKVLPLHEASAQSALVLHPLVPEEELELEELELEELELEELELEELEELELAIAPPVLPVLLELPEPPVFWLSSCPSASVHADAEHIDPTRIDPANVWNLIVRTPLRRLRSRRPRSARSMRPSRAFFSAR